MELLVVIAIIGVLVALLLPAVQAAREAARRNGCVNNIKNLALGCQTYESARKALPFGRKYNYWDTYTWYQAILPYIEQQAIYDLFWTFPQQLSGAPGIGAGPNGPIGDDPRMREARHARIPVFYCPSDGTPIENEITTPAFGCLRGNYRGCVGAGDLYGGLPAGSTFTTAIRQMLVASDSNGLIGAFGARVPGRSAGGNYTAVTVPPTKLAEFSDGTTSTLLFSEGIAPTITGWGGPLGSMIYGNMGGALFSAAETPNTSLPDQIIGPCPQWDLVPPDTEYTAPCNSIGGHPGAANPGAAAAAAYARSRHVGGVNAALADGGVRFVSDSIDVESWRALGTRALADIPAVD
ncbi:MAG: DUF1559 domain-containing protein [Pirellulales bacterium]|nr:DUF1559 domain-containing protein [Pirellulales bacterium]